MMTFGYTRSVTTFVASLLVTTTMVQAHSAEQGFILLLPTDIYIAAGAATVAATILLVPVLARSTLKVSSEVAPPAPSREGLTTVLSLAATLILVGLLWAGLTGPRDPLSNLLPLTIWFLWWIGFVAILPVTGDLWPRLNPWTGFVRLITVGQSPPFTLPARLGVWPGVLVFLCFHVFAIADIAPSDPNRLALIVAGYWLFTCVGMLLFGGPAWLAQVECFSIFFRLIGSLAPVQRSQAGLPGWASLTQSNRTVGHAAFCLVMLGAGSFDGLHETFWWLAQIGINPLEFPGRSAVIWSSTFGMLATCATLAVVFSATVWIGTVLAANSDVTLRRALPPFALSLIPIAFGYHVAHYLTSFLVGIQYTAIAFSDPFATGANLLGMSDLQVTTGFLSDPEQVKIIWLSQAGMVVVSHILAVWMAHSAAAKLYQTQRQILLVQAALSILMIAYTVFGLWLLASPRGV